MPCYGAHNEPFLKPDVPRLDTPDAEQWVKASLVGKDGYFVSNLGRIKVLKHGKEIIKVGSLQNGYLAIAHTFKKAAAKVHHLVMESFTVRPEWAECINHINGVKADNRLINLEWSTVKRNNNHAFDAGLNTNYGENHHASVDIGLVHQIYGLKKQGKRQCDIMRTVGLPRKRVQAIYNGHDWRREYQKFFQ